MPNTTCLPSSHEVVVVHKKELGPVPSRVGVGHGQNARSGMLLQEILVFEFGTVDRLLSSFVARSEVTALAHEPQDHTVEARSLVVEWFPHCTHALFSGAESDTSSELPALDIEQIRSELTVGAIIDIDAQSQNDGTSPRNPMVADLPHFVYPTRNPTQHARYKEFETNFMPKK